MALELPGSFSEAATMKSSDSRRIYVQRINRVMDFMRKSKIRQALLAHAGYGFGIKTLPPNRFAALRSKGDIHKLDRAWNYLFRAWLPVSGYEPTSEPAMEVYRGHPLRIGWEVFDIDCLVPVKPLKARGSSRTHRDEK